MSMPFREYSVPLNRLSTSRIDATQGMAERKYELDFSLAFLTIEGESRLNYTSNLAYFAPSREAINH
ncbi:MAG TPA: hypothetical protein PKD64_15770 [Pirellulaceae bacterium]|nr:hypothetical protein [Pirellulaceae bacterium]HMO93645.1 hypothetical protein [Pirellulaceae bacterium]HMP70649.1 hypothetical protein [Pirellulaceae bacterium]